MEEILTYFINNDAVNVQNLLLLRWFQVFLIGVGGNNVATAPPGGDTTVNLSILSRNVRRSECRSHRTKM